MASKIQCSPAGPANYSVDSGQCKIDTKGEEGEELNFQKAFVASAVRAWVRARVRESYLNE